LALLCVVTIPGPASAADPKAPPASVTLNLPQDASPDYIAKVVAALQSAGLTVNVAAGDKPVSRERPMMAAMEIDNLLNAARQTAETALSNLPSIFTLPGYWFEQMRPAGGSVIVATLRLIAVLLVA